LNDVLNIIIEKKISSSLIEFSFVKGTKISPNYDDGMKAMQVLAARIKSATTGQKVVIVSVNEKM